MFAAAANTDLTYHTQLYERVTVSSSEILCVGECLSKSYLISNLLHLANLFQIT